jgi:hypothetical protein
MESVVSRIVGCNQWPMIPEVLDRDTIDVSHGDHQWLSRPQDATHLGYSQALEDSSRGPDGGWSHSRASMRGAYLRCQSLRLSLGRLPSPQPWVVLPIIIYIYIGKLVPLHHCIPVSPTAASQGLGTSVRQMTPPQRGAPIVDHHDRHLPRGRALCRFYPSLPRVPYFG